MSQEIQVTPYSCIQNYLSCLLNTKLLGQIIVVQRRVDRALPERGEQSGNKQVIVFYLSRPFFWRLVLFLCACQTDSWISEKHVLKWIIFFKITSSSLRIFSVKKWLFLNIQHSLHIYMCFLQLWFFILYIHLLPISKCHFLIKKKKSSNISLLGNNGPSN